MFCGMVLICGWNLFDFMDGFGWMTERVGWVVGMELLVWFGVLIV
jgi:hypothetical protein